MRKSNNRYTNTINKHSVKPKYFKNCIMAFIFGGLICAIGEVIQTIYTDVFSLPKETSVTLMVITLVFAAALMTGFGVYDKIGQLGGAGTIIPVTGFSNALTSSALEYKEESLILGVGGNMFKLAGTVIVYGVVSAYVFGMIRYLIENFI